MAKSIRSKWRRKCRAVKRERYGKKELDRLKKTLGIDETNKTDTDMKEISEVVTVVHASTIRKEKEKKVEQETETTSEMETDKVKRVFNAKTLKDQNGTYPIWMHPRKIHKTKKVTKGKQKKKRRQN